MSVMNQRVVEAINRQINSELSASYSYLAMSAWCERQRFVGAARWLRVQSQEEHMHAMKLLDFLLARDCDVKFLAIQAPQAPYASLLDVFERALEQEQEVSHQIDALYETAFTEKAFAAVAELQWFLTEQVEEEKTGREIVGKLKMIGTDAASLIDMDRELGARVPEPAPPAAT
jgi:ferritin